MKTRAVGNVSRIDPDNAGRFMALIIHGKSECPLCHAVIAKDDDIVATSHFIADPEDPLWRYSDAAIHRTCFESWEQRENFVNRFNAAVAPFIFGNGKRHFMKANGDIIQIDP